MAKVRYLKDIAKVIRSKNAGPLEVTMDIIMNDNNSYVALKQSNIINEDLICKLYHVNKDQIINLIYFDQANGIKISLSRPRPQGTIGETDMHAAQQHVPLMFVEISDELKI